MLHRCVFIKITFIIVCIKIEIKDGKINTTKARESKDLRKFVATIYIT